MSKVSIRVPIPTHKPDDFVQLLKDIVSRHESMGVASPLNDASVVDMADFKAKLLEADALREQSIAMRAEAEAAMEKSKVILGIKSNLSINNPDTLYHMADKIKRLLLIKNRGVEQSLEYFGFHVVTGTTKKVGRKKKQK